VIRDIDADLQAISVKVANADAATITKAVRLYATKGIQAIQYPRLSIHYVI
jgi:hypothetical protein